MTPSRAVTVWVGVGTSVALHAWGVAILFGGSDRGAGRQARPFDPTPSSSPVEIQTLASTAAPPGPGAATGMTAMGTPPPVPAQRRGIRASSRRSSGRPPTPPPPVSAADLPSWFRNEERAGDGPPIPAEVPSVAPDEGADPPVFGDGRGRFEKRGFPTGGGGTSSGLPGASGGGNGARHGVSPLEITALRLTPSVAEALRIEDRFPKVPEDLWAQAPVFSVGVEICVSREGRVSGSRLTKKADPQLDLLLLDSIKSWRYRPLRFDGVPLPFCHDLLVVFTRE